MIIHAREIYPYSFFSVFALLICVCLRMMMRSGCLTLAENPMAPKRNPKVKEKVVHEADLIPQSTCKFLLLLYDLQVPFFCALIYYILFAVNKHKIDTKAFKIHKESHMWNEVLISKDTNDVLAGINGLTDSMSDQICEAVNKITVSLNFFFLDLATTKKTRDVYTAVLCSGFTKVSSWCVHSKYCHFVGESMAQYRK